MCCTEWDIQVCESRKGRGNKYTENERDYCCQQVLNVTRHVFSRSITLTDFGTSRDETPDSDRSTLVRQECDTLAFTFCNISGMNTLTPHRKAKDTSTQPRRILPTRKEFAIE